MNNQTRDAYSGDVDSGLAVVISGSSDGKQNMLYPYTL